MAKSAKTATISIKETGERAAEPDSPPVVAAKVAAIKDVAAENKATRKRLYSNDNWNTRRKVIFILLGFFCSLTAYLVFFAPDDELRRTMALPVVGAVVTLAVGYAGFATWDDNDKRANLAADKQEVVTVVEAG